MTLPMTITSQGFGIGTPFGMVLAGLAMKLPPDRTDCEACGAPWLLYRISDGNGTLAAVLCHKCYLSEDAYRKIWTGVHPELKDWSKRDEQA